MLKNYREPGKSGLMPGVPRCPQEPVRPHPAPPTVHSFRALTLCPGLPPDSGIEDHGAVSLPWEADTGLSGLDGPAPDVKCEKGHRNR